MIVYTQDELCIMQYEVLSEILKELAVSNANTNQFGLTNLSLTGSKLMFQVFLNCI